MPFLRQFTQSLRFAFRGLRSVYRSEQNFRIQCAVFLAVLLLAAVLRVRAWEMVALCIAGTAVLVLECMNSAVERLLDLVQPRLHGYVREIKDTMAGAVLISSIGAAVIGIAILVPHLV